MRRTDQGLGIGGWGKKSRGWGRGAGGWGFAILLATLGASLPGFARQRDESNPVQNLTIVLHVYDYAQVDPRELVRAQDEASTVLQRIGIEAAWLNCPVPGVKPQNSQDCRSTAGALVLRILPQAMAERMGRQEDSLGFAQNADNDTPGFVASVFYHRVDALASEFGCPRAVVLGYALAHETGHLLLGTNSHSPNGIMKANWTEKELLSASAGRFGFFPQQAAKMRADVRARREKSYTSETAREGRRSLEATTNRE